jgi:hypothetical protein
MPSATFKSKFFDLIVHTTIIPNNKPNANAIRPRYINATGYQK